MVVSLPGCRLLGPLQALDVELLHLHHRLHDALRYCGIGIAEELRQRGRNDLPRQAELVLEPAAHLLLSAGGELLPLLVDLFLGLAIHDERYGLRDLEPRPAVQGDEFLPVQLEHRGHDRALRPRSRVSVADDLSLFRIPENGDIEIHRLLGPAVEPQEWGDFLHRERPASRESSAWLSASPAGLRRAHACRPTSGGRTGPRAGRSGRPRTGRLRASSPDRKSTRLNSSHITISYAVFCLKKKKKDDQKNI